MDSVKELLRRLWATFYAVLCYSIKQALLFYSMTRPLLTWDDHAGRTVELEHPDIGTITDDDDNNGDSTEDDEDEDYPTEDDEDSTDRDDDGDSTEDDYDDDPICVVLTVYV